MLALLSFAVYLVSQIIVVNIAVVYSLVSGFYENSVDFVYKYATELTMLAGILTLLIYTVGFLIKKRNPLHEICIFKMKGIYYPTAFILGISLNFLVVGLISILPIPEDWLWSYISATSESGVGSLTPIIIIITAIGAPIVEEVVFRGMIYTRFRRGMPMLGAMLISSFLFGIMHGTTILWVSYAAVLGFVLTYVYEKCGSLLAPMLLHMGFNLVGALSALLPEEISFEVISIITLVSAMTSAALLGIIRHNSPRKIEVSKVADQFGKEKN